MTSKAYSSINGKLNFIDIIFVMFSFFPFIIPNPIVITNIQPYAVLLGILVILKDVFLKNEGKLKIIKTHFFEIAWFTLFVSIMVLLFSPITVSSFRALFNYLSVAVIPLAFCILINSIGEYPEKLIKALILVWFMVATIQFFVDRSFLTSIIGGVRFSYSYRGVVGLASEPSFFGIACFYFLHMTMKFKKNQEIFLILILVMGIVYAQSMMGLMFIGMYIAIYLLDLVNTRKGLYIWVGAVIAVIAFLVALNTVLVNTRLHQLISLFLLEGTGGVMNDASAETRFSAIVDAIKDSFDNYLLPRGFTRRIGSGYGGFLCELGFFAIPILLCISRVLSLTFKKKSSQVLYFVVVTILLFNNTQIGNPLLLLVLGTNIASVSIVATKNYSEKKEKYADAKKIKKTNN